MKLSIITAVYDSHEVVRRQFLHYKKMNLPYNVEIIYIDDGSDPPLENAQFYTNDIRSWTEHKARNEGVRISKGEYIFLIDVDYIIPYETIMMALKFNGDMMPIRRRFGILDGNGDIKYDKETLKRWGTNERWLKRRYIPGHRSQFVIRKELFWKLGGYKENLEGRWRITGGAGEKFWRKWQRAETRKIVKMSDGVLDVFMFPSGKFSDREDRENPFGFFHDLKRN